MMEFDYSKLLGKVKEKYGTQNKFAEALGMGRTSFSQRINNRLEFHQEEMYKAIELLEEPIDSLNSYFYAQKVHVNEHEQKV